LLEIDSLIAGHDGRPAARLRHLALAGGQAALLLGPSGSGKTSLLLTIAGLSESLGGSAKIDGVEVLALPRPERDRFRGRFIGLIFQDLHLVAGLSALDNLLLAPFAAGLPQDRRRALDLLDQLGLFDHADRPAERLSRGEAQRVAIARAMLLKPKAILADEPTASLDDQACDQVAELLARAAGSGDAALLIATHDQRLRRRFPVAVQAEPWPERRSAA